MNNFNLNNINLNKIITIMVAFIVFIAIILLLTGNRDNAELDLKGLSSMMVYENDRFTDPGYEIINGKEDGGYYINVEGVVNTNKVGIYYLRYLLYNKSGRLLSEKERRVAVLQDNISNIRMNLIGEEEEAYFVGDYVDQGIEVSYLNEDVTSYVNVFDNVKAKTPGTYEVRYQYTRGKSVKEVIRTVYIMELDKEENVNLSDKRIDLYIKNKGYSYTILPDGRKEYSKDISYHFNEIGIYNFDIYLKSGSHYKYSLDISKVDKEGPTGTCVLAHSNGKTTITMKVTDPSGIAKYSYNGVDFRENTMDLTKLVPVVTVVAYDNNGNSSSIKCRSEYNLGFKDIPIYDNGRKQVEANDNGGFIICGTNFSKENQELKELMESYGMKTRWAVAAAGEYIARYKNTIGYFWGGKYIQQGFNPEWGCRKSHSTDHKCDKPMASDYSVCQWGLDCSGLVLWAYAQAGFTKEEMRTDDLSGGRWGGTSGKFIAKQHRYNFYQQSKAILDQIKPGDIVHREGHVALIIGVSEDKLQIVEMLGPMFVSTIEKSTGRSLNGQRGFTDFVLMDEYFKLYGNPN